jgi:hypothetical protein
MLVLQRIAHEPISGARYEIHEALHTLFRVRVTRTVGVIVDEHLLYPAMEWTGDGARPQAEVTLEGKLRNTENGEVRWVPPGSFALGGALSSLYARVERDSLILSVDWALGSLGARIPRGLPTGNLSPGAHRALIEHANAITRGDLSVVAPLLDVLRAEGVPLDPVRAEDLHLEIDEEDRAVIAALTAAMCNLAASPMSVDLERTLGRSRRHVVDSVRRVTQRFGLNGSDWRSLRDRFRLNAAAVLCTHELARTETVARAVGYGSGRALCHALARAGLPTASAMRDAVESLR